MDSIPTTLSHLRRPTTVDESAFWYFPLSKWQDLIAEVKDKRSDKAKARAALQYLRKVDGTGRMMETDEGTVGKTPCHWCSRQGTVIECRVSRNKDDISCAYCRRVGKAGCTAKQSPESDPTVDFVKKPELVEPEERVAKTEKLLRTVNRSLKRRRMESDTESGDDSDPMLMHTLKTFYYDDEEESFRTKTTTKAIGLHDILIKTTHSGLCYTDVHAKSQGCGLGHEGVGFVQEVGQAIAHLRVGDRVGWGWLHSVCLDGSFATISCH